MNRLFLIVTSCTFFFLYCSDVCSVRLRDPTKPPIVESVSEKSSPINVTVIFSKNGKKWALINGQYVTEGQSIGKLKIITIKAYSVVVEQAGRRQEVLLISPVIRKSQ